MEVQVTASTNSAQTNPEANIASQILARYRAVAKQYGRFFSEQIYTIVGTNPDLKYKEDVLNDKNTLRKEVTVFLIKPIDITGLKFLPKDFDGEPKIMLNPESNDPNLVFNLVPPQLARLLQGRPQVLADLLFESSSELTRDLVALLEHHRAARESQRCRQLGALDALILAFEVVQTPLVGG